MRLNYKIIILGYIDNLAVRYYTTSNLRAHELGTLAVGTVASGYAITIPPGLEQFEIFTQCDSTCIDKVSHLTTQYNN